MGRYLFLARAVLLRGIQPSGHSVRNIRNITWSSSLRIVQIAFLDVSRIVTSSCLIYVSIFIDALDKTLAFGCTLSAIDDHLVDGCGLSGSRGGVTDEFYASNGLHETTGKQLVICTGENIAWKGVI